MEKISVRRFIIPIFFSFVLLAILSITGLAAEAYMFERMWPVLDQPWYFMQPSGIATDREGNIYVADTGNDRIQKFSSTGGFITKWGTKGPGDGEFSYPYDIAIDGQGNVYVADAANNRIQKFSSAGEFITKWGNEGSANGEFSHPYDIAIDDQGNVYVAEYMNNRVQKFTSSGAFILKWGSTGSADGQFSGPHGIAIDDQGNVYVAEYMNNRVQKFTSSGLFIEKWGNPGSGDGELHSPTGITLDSQGNIYVADFGNDRIQKFNSSGVFITKWGSEGSGDGQFNGTVDVALDNQGNIYVADYLNDRIQKFGPSGAFFAKWSSGGSGDGEFYSPTDIAPDGQENMYVADRGNHRIQKFDSSGAFITKWGSKGSGDGQFSHPSDVALDNQGNIYVADAYNHRIQKFTSTGVFITKWGSEGNSNGQFNSPGGISIDEQGNVYVADTYNHRIQKFTSTGVFITKWGSRGSSNGQLNTPGGISIDEQGNVYVADSWNYRIQKFDSSGAFITKWGSGGIGDGQFSSPSDVSLDNQGNVYVVEIWNNRIQKFSLSGAFMTKFGSFGSEPGLLNCPVGLTVTSSGKVYVADQRNNRIQVFGPSTSTITDRKAIVVAGSGPYATNELWDATQMCANYAYRALTYQGYTRGTIYYLSADTDLDLDNDGYPDVDADATNANLQYAITSWAQDADNLLLYMVGHGGEGTFQMGQFELLNATELDAWLDATQQTIPDFVTLVYDGCHSGSFVPYLIPPAGKTRILATSADVNEPAVFQADGGLSFGYQFFSYLFNGGSFYESFVHGQKTVQGAYDYKQTPVIEGNGNGIGNEKADKEIAQAIKLGNETKSAGDIPQIQSVSPAQTLAEGVTSAVIYAQKVMDVDGIQEVFAVIKPPDYSSGFSDNPVTDLPTIHLKDTGNNTYSGTYKGFTVEGTYNIAVFARDRKGTLSLPAQTSVTVSVTTDCLPVAADLSIRVPCAEYIGNPYGFTLDSYRNPDDPAGLYWKLVLATLTTGQGENCLLIGSDLSMPIPCASYNGAQYGFTLNLYHNPYDPSGLYWKMDVSTLVVK
ncbi:MAG: 6-bladed beta-propeller [Deltaproteobacteria bacterium]|nr:6-bladed beta-propeller [Deltaproteobacteria bacterium]